MKDGNYKARAASWSINEDRSGNTVVRIKFQISGTSDTVEWTGWSGEAVAIGAKSPSLRTAEVLETCGWNHDEEFTGIDKNEVSVKVETREGKSGQSYQVVAFVNKLWESTPASKEARKQFFKSLLNAKRNAETSSASSPNPPKFEDERLPF